MKKILLLLALSCGMIATAQYDITYNLKKGGVYPQNQKVTSEQEQVINGMPQKTTTSIITETDYQVTDIKNDIYYIDLVTKKISNITKSQMGVDTLTSDGTSSNPMNKLFENMIKYPIKITMDNKGEILSFDNSKQLENLVDGIDMPEMQLAQIVDGMKEQMSAESQLLSYERISAILPKSKVKVGDTWEQTITVTSIGTFESVINYKLDSVTDDYYMISASANLQTPQGSSTNLMGMDAKFDLSGPSTASYKIDRKTGWIKTATIDQTLDGAVLIEKSEMMPQEMKMTMKTKTTTVIE